MASGPITSWQIDGESVETGADFIFGGSKITADGDCSHNIKRHLLIGKKGMTSLDSILKSRDIALPTKVHLSRLWFFQWSWMDVSWTLKNWFFWTVVLKILESPFQCILKEISPGCSLKGLILKLKLQTLATWCQKLTHLKRPCYWERLKAGEEGNERGWDDWMTSPTQWTWVWVNFGSWWWTGKSGVLWSLG